LVCQTCRTENREGAKFCRGCGAPLSAVCPTCSAAVEQGQPFCDECGTPLTASAAPRSGTAGENGGGQAVSEPELRLVSVLFVDLVGFTSLSEGRAAEDVRELLGRYFDVARGTVERYGGTIEKFIGDAVMAVWGVPAAHEDDAERTVRAALDIVEEVAEFGASVGAPELRARAGVVTGQAAAVENPAEGIVTGDKVNTASRVQSAAQPGSVLVDAMTHQLTQAAVVFEDAGEHTVKGKSEPLQLWRAVRVVAGVGGRDRERLFEAPFVGRDGELRLLKELLDQTVERSSARLVAVSGDAGIGKSRLRREFSNYTDGLSRSFLWHDGRCLAHGDGVAFWALAEMVRQRLRIPEDAPTAEVAAKLDAGLSEWITNTEERDYIRPRLGALLGASAPGLERAELFGGWRMFFERLAAHEPVVLVFEDMQWADAGLLAFVDQLVEWSRLVPIFILSFARPELAAKHGGWPAGRRGVTTIDLEPLTDSAMMALLEGAVADLPPDARAQIVERAQGNPLYAVETIRSLADRGVLERDGDRLLAVGELGELDTPASLNALLAARLDALEPDERELVKSMSVFGGSFPLAAVAALAGIESGQAAPLLDALVRKQVLVMQSDPLAPDHGQYAFAQGLLRAVAYDTLARRTRKQLHLRAAEHLRLAFANDGEEVAEVIANHILEAFTATNTDEPDHDELRRQAVAALQRSADRAESVGAQAVSWQALRRAAELADEYDRPTLLGKASQMARTAGFSEEALDLAEAAAELFGTQGRARERALMADPARGALLALGRVEEARRRMEDAIETLGELAGASAALDPDRVDLLAQLGQVLVVLHDYARAEPLLIEACAAAEALEANKTLANACITRASIYTFGGRPQEAVAMLRLAAELADRHDLRQAGARAFGDLGTTSIMHSLPGAREHAERDLANVRRLGHAFNEAVSTHNLVEAYVDEGLWDEAERVAAETRERVPSAYTDAYVGYPLVRMYAMQGDTARLLANLEPVAASFADSEDPWTQMQGETVALIARSAEGDDAGVVRRGLELAAIAAEKLGEDSETPNLQAWSHLLDAALSLGDLDAATRVVDIVSARPPGHVTPSLRAQLVRGQALLASASGEYEAVEPGLRDAIERFEKINWVYWHAATEVDLAAWLVDQGRAEEAAGLLEHAISVLEPLRAVPALTRARAVSERLAGARAPVR
jgi:class 3 adenylate cyclase/predicted ATPase